MSKRLKVTLKSIKIHFFMFLAARQRYHRMTSDEKKLYNQRRTEAFRRRRMEEELLLATPIGQISGDGKRIFALNLSL